MTAGRKWIGRGADLLLHLAALVALLAASVALATVSGGLWPFDPRFSVLIAAGGLAVLAVAWWPAALVVAAVAALLPHAGLRLAFWPVAVLAMVALHAAFGPALGFVPLGDLGGAGALRLYAIPAALPVLAGSALRVAISGRRRSGAGAAPASRERSAP